MKLNSKGIVQILIVAVIALLIGVIGTVSYFKFSTKTSTTPTSQTTRTSTPASLFSTPTPSPQDETANWKTYKSEFYSYMLSYPNGASLSEEMKAQGVKARLEQVTTITYKGGSLEITGNSGGRGVTSVKSSEIVVGGKPTTKFYESERSGIIKAITSPKKDDIYFTFNLPFSNRDEVDKTFDQILSTFKFL